MKKKTSPGPASRKEAGRAITGADATTEAPDTKQRTESARASKYFLPYQLTWLGDDSRIKIWEKSRRIGATYVQSYEDVRDIVEKKEYVPGRPVRKVYFTSADESAAREYIDYCAQWAKLYNMAAQSLGEVILDSEKDIKALAVEFKNGGKIYALTSNPKRFRSKGGKCVWDEAAWHEDQFAMWKALRPSAMWGYPIRILSTHHGKQSLFFQFVDDVNAKKSDWSLHTVTIYKAVEDGLLDKIFGRATTEAEKRDWLDKEKRDCRSDEIWEEEYCCNAQDAATAFVEYELIAGCETAGIELSIEQLAELSEGDLYAGWDVARKRDYSVFWLVQRLGDVLITRHVKDFVKTRFAIQKAFLAKVMALPRLRRICIDQTGMGLPLTEEAQERWSSRVEGVTFTNATKEALGYDGKNSLEDRRARIPKSDLVRESFHSVKKITTTAGNVRLDADATEAGGHADHWWAFCLARHAAKGSSGPVDVTSRPKKERLATSDYADLSALNLF